MSASAIVPLGIKDPTPPTKPIVIRKCTDDCCAVQVFAKRFTIITTPDGTEPVTSYMAAVHKVRDYLDKHQIMEATA
jgi:hypothetical protein